MEIRALSQGTAQVRLGFVARLQRLTPGRLTRKMLALPHVHLANLRVLAVVPGDGQDEDQDKGK